MIAMGKISRPVIGKLPETLFSGNRTGFSEAIMSPKSPLDFKIRSPRGLQNCESGAVGLGIVAALDKSGEIPAKLIVGSLSLNHSDPIPISSSTKTSAKPGGKLQSFEIDCSENYTCVTYHEPKKSAFTKVYYNGGEDEINGHDRSNYDRNYRNVKVNCEPPPRFGDTIQDFPVSDFLSSCYLCRKKLHGKDIYMYRGEKGFCSTECRYRQIVSDERKEKCRAETSRRTEISSSPIFFTGIIAA